MKQGVYPIMRSMGVTAIGIVFTLLIVFIDYITGYQLSFSIFYLIPIVFVTWFEGRWLGLAMAAMGMLLWAFADHLSGQRYDPHIILFWNAAVRFGFFCIIVCSLSRIKIALVREHQLSRMDTLTALANRTAFNERLQLEIDRAKRAACPLSLAYIDCDNFKKVNDTYGHHEGDLLLARIGTMMNENTRSTDLAARIGGDEFAVILPDTEAEGAVDLIKRLQSKLEDVMKQKRWPVTFSIGLVTYLSPPGSVADAIGEADRLMYTVKGSIKGSMKQLVIN